MTSKLEQTRRALYFAQRTIGDVQAVQRGPKVIARRLVRRSIVRAIFKAAGL